MVDTIITLYEQNESSFTTNGLGSLKDATKCIVVEERNGIFELEMEYPVNGRHYSDLALRRLIFAKPNPYDDPQPFRIYSISRPLKGIVTVNARHISYDLADYVCLPFVASTYAEVLTHLNNSDDHYPQSIPFTFYFDANIGLSTAFEYDTSVDPVKDERFKVLVPKSIRNVMGDDTGCVLDKIRIPNSKLKCEYRYDKFNVYLNAPTGANSRGKERGFEIRYGKNLTDVEKEESSNNDYTDIFPYWKSLSDGATAKILDPDHVSSTVPIPGASTNYKKIKIVDLSSDFDSEPTVETMREYANNYIKENELDGSPDVTITVNFQNLAKSSEYANFAISEVVKLCDTVKVIHEGLGIADEKKVIKTEYDAIADQYTSIEIGTPKDELAETVSVASTTTVSNTNITDILKETVTDAIKSQMTIYYLADAQHDPPPAPTAWITSTSLSPNQWTKSEPTPISGYTLYTSTQTEALSNNKVTGAIISFATPIVSTLKSKVNSWLGSDNDTVDGSNITAKTVNTAQIADKAINTAQIEDKAVDTAQIADRAVDTDQLEIGSVEEDIVADDAISTSKLQAYAVEADKIAASAVTTDKLDAEAVTAEKIATDALHSRNFEEFVPTKKFAKTGTFFDLSDGKIKSVNFAIDSSGNAEFKGTITAEAGYIGTAANGFEIQNNLLKGTYTVDSKEYNVYLETDGRLIMRPKRFELQEEYTSSALQEGILRLSSYDDNSGRYGRVDVNSDTMGLEFYRHDPDSATDLANYAVDGIGGTKIGGINAVRTNRVDYLQTSGTWYLSNDTYILGHPNQTLKAWIEAIEASGYVLPPATTTTLGGVIVGANLSVGDDGMLSVNTNYIATRSWVTNNFAKPSDIKTYTAGDGIDISSSNAVSVKTGSGLTMDGNDALTIDSTVALKTDIPTVNNATLTIQRNGTTVKTFTANASSNVTANISVPVNVSELTNDSGYLTSIPTASAQVKGGVKVDATGGLSVTNEVLKVNLGTGLEFGNSTNVIQVIDYANLAKKSEIPTVNNATLTIQKNGTTVKTFTANASSNVTANITVPTKTSDLTNDSGFITGITWTGVSSKPFNTVGDGLEVDTNKILKVKAGNGIKIDSDADNGVAVDLSASDIPTLTSAKISDFDSAVDTALGIGTGSTFLRKDGTWATPTNTTYTGEKGITVSSAHKIGHTSTYTAKSTQAVYPITIDTYGHIASVGNAVTIPTKTSDLSNDSGFLTSIPTAGTNTIGGVKIPASSVISNTSGAIDVKYGTGLDVDDDNNLVIASTVALKTDIKTYTGEKGITVSSSNAVGHTNTYTAKTTQAVYPIKIDTYGHISAVGNAVTIPTITLNGTATTTPSFYAPTGAGTSGQYLKSNGSGAPSWTNFPTIPTIPGADRGISLVSSKYGHSNTAIDAVTTQGMYKISFDAYGHIDGYTATAKADITGLLGAGSSGSTRKFLNQQGGWTTPTNTTYGFSGSLSNHAFTSTLTEGGSGTTSVLTLAAGSNITLTDDTTNKKITIAATDTTYSAGTGIAISSANAISNSGVRSVTINGNNLRVNTNGTNADLTIPYATSAGSAPASDVYAWAKAATKPTYTASEVGALPSSTTYVSKITTFAGSHTAITNASGAVSFSVPTKTSHLTNDSGFLTSHQTIYEENINWGPTSVHKAGNVSPIGMALSSEHSANRLAFINGDALTFEYSSNGGSTYTNYNYTAAQKTAFCTTALDVPIGRTSGQYTTSSRTRITLTATNSSHTYVYTDPVKLLINISSSGGMEVLIEYRTGTNMLANGAWSTFGTYSLSGWSGWNDIPLILGTLGGGISQKSHNWQLRLTFIMTSVNASYPSTASVSKIRLFGRNSWNTPSTLASTGHLYSYDDSKNATFPANITATNFSGTFAGYTLAAACAKGVDTSIAAASTSTNLPTSKAVAAFVEGKGYITSSGNTWRPVKYGSTTVNDKTTTLEFVAGNVIDLTFASGKLTINHESYGDAVTTQGLYKISIDKYGHIDGYTAYTDQDTKNTAGSTDTSSKIFLIGATSQAANPQTYSHDTCYVGTNGHLYSASKEVLVGGSNAASSVTITPSTTSVYSMSSAGSVTNGTAPSFTRGTFSGGSLSFAMDTTDTRKLKITFTAATHAADSFSAGTTPPVVTLPGRTQVTGLWNGYTAATAAAQTFTGAKS